MQTFILLLAQLTTFFKYSFLSESVNLYTSLASAIATPLTPESIAYSTSASTSLNTILSFESKGVDNIGKTPLIKFDIAFLSFN